MLTPSSTTAERAVREMLFRGREQELNALYPRLLVLLDDHWIGMEEGLAAVQKLRSCHFRMTIWASESIMRRLGPKGIAEKTGVDSIIPVGDFTDSFQIEKGCEVILLPVLNFSMLSKLSKLDDAEPFSRAVIQGLCSGKKVAALTAGIDSQLPEWRSRGLTQPPAMQQRLQEMLRDIKSLGVNMLRMDQITSLSAETTRRKTLITAEDVTLAYKQGERILNAQGKVVITPLAKDLASQYGMIIHESGHMPG